MVDAAAGVLGIEWIEGKSVRHLLPGCANHEGNEQNDAAVCMVDDALEGTDALEGYGVSLGVCYCSSPPDPPETRNPETLMQLIGIELGKMHSADVIHGDLTTSNMMLRHPSIMKSPADIPRQLVRYNLVIEAQILTPCVGFDRLWSFICF